MRPYKKYSLTSIAFLFLTGAPSFSSAYVEEDGQTIVNNIVAILTGRTPPRTERVDPIPLDDNVSQGVLQAFHTLHPGCESHLTPGPETTSQPSTSSSHTADDGTPHPSGSTPLAHGAPKASPPPLLSPALVPLSLQVERQSGICQEAFSIDNMTSFLANCARLLDEMQANLIALNGQVPESDTQSTFRAALITAMLKKSLMPSGPLAEACLPGEYLGGLMSSKHASARQYASLRKDFSLELIRHKNACLGQYGTWTTQLRSLTGLCYESPERTAFDGLHRYCTRLWEAFFNLERCARDIGLVHYPEDSFYGLLGDAGLLHWTANTPAFAQKLIQTWDTLFIYYTHHLLANAANSALDRIPDLLRANGIDLARVNAQPYQTHGAAPLVFIQAPQEKEEDSAVDENTVSIKEGESSSDESDDGGGLDAPDSPNERTPLYPPVLLPETAPLPAFNAFEAFMAMPLQDPAPHHTGEMCASTCNLPSCWKVFGVDPEWDLSELCQDDQTGEEGDIPSKDGYNGTND